MNDTKLGGSSTKMRSVSPQFTMDTFNVVVNFENSCFFALHLDNELKNLGDIECFLVLLGARTSTAQHRLSGPLFP